MATYVAQREATGYQTACNSRRSEPGSQPHRAGCADLGGAAAPDHQADRPGHPATAGGRGKPGQAHRGCPVERLPLVAITAPAGYGKSMFLAEWAAAEDRRVVWVSLDRFDDDPAMLLVSLASAYCRAPGQR